MIRGAVIIIIMVMHIPGCSPTEMQHAQIEALHGQVNQQTDTQIQGTRWLKIINFVKSDLTSYHTSYNQLSYMTTK